MNEQQFINVGTDYEPFLINTAVLKDIVSIERFTYDTTRITFKNGKEVFLASSCKNVMEALCPEPEVEEEGVTEEDE